MLPFQDSESQQCFAAGLNRLWKWRGNKVEMTAKVSARITNKTGVSPARVAVVQFSPQVGVENREANRAAVQQRLEQAVDKGANLIVLPELGTTGYVFETRQEAFAHAEPVPSGPTVQGWEAFTKAHGVYVVGCLAEMDGARLFDTAVLLGPDGYVGKYRKTHLWNEEKLFFEPGDLGFPVFNTPLGRIGMLICWDIWFPETARLIAQQGADIICIPTGWVVMNSPVYDDSGISMPAYLTITAAYVNAVPIATAARNGEERGVKFLGNSLIAGTDGWPVGGVVGAEEDTIRYADIDITAARTAPIINKHNDLHRDRRVDLYDRMLGYRGAVPFAR